MFTFSNDVPANIRRLLIPRLQAWIERASLPRFSLATAKYGLVTFRRDPWPIKGATVVSPAGDADIEALQKYSQGV